MIYPDLYLTYVGYDSVEFDAHHKDGIRKVSVKAGSNMMLFPHVRHQSGESFGDDDVDLFVRMRAFEEITRYRCYRLGDVA